MATKLIKINYYKSIAALSSVLLLLSIALWSPSAWAWDSARMGLGIVKKAEARRESPEINLGDFIRKLFFLALRVSKNFKTHSQALIPIPFPVEVVELRDDVLSDRADASVLLPELVASCLTTELGD
jgi:hypothetical protein